MAASAGSDGVTPTTPSPASPPPGEPAAAQDDVKRRFREALDRKRGRAGDAGAGGEAGGQNKVHGGAHGPASHQRQFRRKSGG